ncbi:MAG TPA: hypothetical protein VF695_06390 [Sphingomonas sp.]|jgi:hypothetical protein
MKTFRKSASTETRNARRAIAFRGGARNHSPNLSQSQQILTGRRLRRASRSGARIEGFVVPEEGAPHRPTIAIDIDPYLRTILSCRIIEA